MRKSIASSLVTGGTAFAKERAGIPDAQGCVSAMGGFVSASDTTGDLLLEGVTFGVGYRF